MRYSRTPLGKTIYTRVVILGVLLMLGWLPWHTYRDATRMGREAMIAYRNDATDEAKDRLMAVTMEAIRSTRLPTLAFLVWVPLLLILAFIVSRPVDAVQMFIRNIIIYSAFSVRNIIYMNDIRKRTVLIKFSDNIL